MTSHIYKYIVRDNCIDRLVNYSRENCKSMYDIELIFKYHVLETAKKYAKASENMSKVFVIAYNKTIKEMNKDE